MMEEWAYVRSFDNDIAVVLYSFNIDMYQASCTITCAIAVQRGYAITRISYSRENNFRYPEKKCHYIE